MELTSDMLRESALNIDLRIEKLKIIIEGVDNAIKHLYDSELSIDWSGSMDEKKENELLYRYAILACENYINSTLNFFFEENSSKFNLSNFNVDLIITLAKLITSETENHEESLKKFNLDVNNYPIYNGILLLNKNKNLNEIIDILVKWRVDLIHFVYPQ